MDDGGRDGLGLQRNQFLRIETIWGTGLDSGHVREKATIDF